ncbi:Gfo/Idh/MocA family oxidoreductase [Paenibacillus antri]|uniref:Gfo/Idh/MocA family oxidoreductase n=1 Tax=Paenibacillus antri TaxID=2582848 RepID=A0A5R9GBE9_9BACL|nr:Gfo/Idh/MocA family oxidoreductase [Paenibacillus antri]TLS52419.1 Gfo/Idh/MocA family oxidoreductase [Paenibacillus antri]
MLKVAVIGTGTMGGEHVAAWRNVERARVTAVLGRNKDKAEALANACGAAAYDSFEAMIEEAEIDAVDICLPTHLHREFAGKAADAGKHVLCEKPIALDPEEAESMIARCRERGVRLLIGHDLRFCPEYVQARELVLSGKLGKVGTIRMSRRSRFPEGADGWYGDSAKSGGVITDLLIHDIDWLRWTFGEAERVTALRVGGSGEAPLDYALVAVRMRSGAIAQLEGSWAHTEFDSSFELSGTGGMLVEHMADSAPLRLHARSGPGKPQAVAVPDMSLSRNSYELELAHMTDCLLDGAEPIVSARDAAKALEIARAAVESARTGRPVALVREEDKR